MEEVIVEHGRRRYEGGEQQELVLFRLDDVFLRANLRSQPSPWFIPQRAEYEREKSRAQGRLESVRQEARVLKLATAQAQPKKGPKLKPNILMPDEALLPTDFPTNCRVVRRELHETPPLEELEQWAAEVGLKIGSVANTRERRRKALALCWVYRDLNSTGLSDIKVTDLIEHKVHVIPGAQPYTARYRRRTPPEQDAFMCQTVDEGLQRTPRPLYIRCLSPWNAPPRIVVRPDRKLRFTVNYRGINRVEVRSSH